jgi:hypothetical protein
MEPMKERSPSNEDARRQVLDRHVEAEQKMDYEAAVATTSTSVRYEFPLQGLCFSGRENAMRFYALGAEDRFRKASRIDAQLPQSSQLHQWIIGGTLIAEMKAYSVMTQDGVVHTHPMAAVIIAEHDGIVVERIYVNDSMFQALTAHVSEVLRPMIS